ncbi:MAG: hypothetical protein C0478_10790 [Planctomyces sp.]|nr:hypothetical protein [Planctomyces sp.]
MFEKAAAGVDEGEGAGQHGFRQHAAEALGEAGMGVEPGIPLAKEPPGLPAGGMKDRPAFAGLE